jgi:hypothetical protein
MRLHRFRIGARSDRIKQGVCTTPTRNCVRTSYTARSALATNRLASFSRFRSADFERDSCDCGCAWATQHQVCQYQIGIQIPQLPRPSQTPAASFSSPYRKRLGSQCMSSPQFSTAEAFPIKASDNPPAGPGNHYGVTREQ